MQVFHGSCAENDEKSHPKRGALEWDNFVGLSLVGFVFGSKDDGVQKQGEKTKHEKQFNHEDHEVSGVVLNTGACLRDQDLIDVVEVYAAGE
jgi:hypothetical protein